MFSTQVLSGEKLLQKWKETKMEPTTIQAVLATLGGAAILGGILMYRQVGVLTEQVRALNLSLPSIVKHMDGLESRLAVLDDRLVRFDERLRAQELRPLNSQLSSVKERR